MAQIWWLSRRVLSAFKPQPPLPLEMGCDPHSPGKDSVPTVPERKTQPAAIRQGEGD